MEPAGAVERRFAASSRRRLAGVRWPRSPPRSGTFHGRIPGTGTISRRSSRTSPWRRSESGDRPGFKRLDRGRKGRAASGRGPSEPDEEQVAIAAVTASGLLHGVHPAKGVRQRSRREAFVEHLLSHLPVIPFDLTVARIHARVATRDDRSFPCISELKVMRWCG